MHEAAGRPRGFWPRQAPYLIELNYKEKGKTFVVKQQQNANALIFKGELISFRWCLPILKLVELIRFILGRTVFF